MTVGHELFALQPQGHTPHSLHAPDRQWRESNCYADLWVGILHGLRLEVEPAFAFTLRVDFEHDQWTFYKPDFADLEALYGVRVEEMSLWTSVLEHCQTQIAHGRLPMIEADSFYLPDTQGTDYAQAHVKTTIGITRVDPDARRLHYFHNAGFFALEGKDFDGIFRLDRSTPDDYMEPYCEYVTFDRLVRRDRPALRDLAIAQGRRHLALRPDRDPFALYAEEIDAQLEGVVGRGEETFHRHVFATIRQLGSGFDFCAHYLRWIDGEDLDLMPAADAFDRISDTAKMLILKTARIARTGRMRSVRANVEQMSADWQRGMALLDDALA